MLVPLIYTYMMEEDWSSSFPKFSVNKTFIYMTFTQKKSIFVASNVIKVKQN